jgi:hypothetical protein
MISASSKEHGQPRWPRSISIVRTGSSASCARSPLPPSARNVAVVDQMIGRYAHAESTLAEALTPDRKRD